MTIEEIYKNKEELSNIKKLAIKHTDCVSNRPVKESDCISKAIELKDYSGTDLQKVIANTYYWLDSHQDVHVKGTFTKSIKENANKIYHLDNHDSKNGFRSKVGNVKEIKEVEVKWKDLGVNKEGTTICVIGATELIEDYNKQVFDAYKNGEIDQHSVGMIYLDMQLAINDKQYPEEFKAWNEVYPLLGNPEEADKLNYFWIQKQAKLKEISCVLWDGSNSLTPSIKQDIEPLKDTLDTEPTDVTQTTELLKQLLNKF